VDEATHAVRSAFARQGFADPQAFVARPGDGAHRVAPPRRLAN
jgi:hypothetical protein